VRNLAPFLAALALVAAAAPHASARPRNLILFVADGLRSGGVDGVTALGLTLPARGAVTGRVMEEALSGGPAGLPTSRREVRSAPGPGGFVTQLDLSGAGGQTYYDEAGAPGRTFGLRGAGVAQAAADGALPGTN